MKLVAALVLVSLASPVIVRAAAPPDSALWLEEVTGKRALEWVAGKNRVSTHALTGTADFKKMNDRFLAIANSDARIPYVTRIGDLYYNFWRDQKHERGLWRRTTLDEYRKASPHWETVLDLDSLAAAEKDNWVWEGADALPPDYTRCLVSLSRGGADARVTREFDFVTRTFVAGGFTVPESKSYLGWIDKDRLYVGPALDSTQMTTSGYPRTVREWRRGQPLASATAVYEGTPTDVWAYGWHDFTPGFERDFVARGITFYSNEMFLRRDGKLVKIEKPDDADAGVWHEWLLLQLRTDWSVGGQTYPAGALLATRLDDFLAGKRSLDVLFQPTERKSLTGYSTTRGAILLNELDHVRCRIEALRFADGRWSREALPGLPEYGDVSASGVDDRVSDDYWLRATDFLTPPRFGIGTVGSGAAQVLKRSPTFFDGSRDTVTQHEAISKDGTRIPYFEVSRRNEPYRGTTPTLLTGYGGFEVSELPYYSGIEGSGLDRAGRRAGARQHPRWRRVRPPVASGGGEDGAASLLRGLHRRRRGSRAARGHVTEASGLHGWLERRSASGQHAHDASRSVRCDRVRAAAARHAALSQAARRRVVDGRVRQPGRSEGMGVHPHLVAVPEPPARHAVSAHTLHQLDTGRSCPPGARAPDGPSDGRHGLSRPLLRERRRRARRGREQQGDGVHVGARLYVPLAAARRERRPGALGGPVPKAPPPH
jgi:prolyl oligopeptidase